jgi:NodT family efflux transporter outer membrane factor (OMF) lipoprotein
VRTYSLLSGGPSVSFAPDVFGLTVRRVEQQSALAENQAYRLAAAQLAISGNVVAQALTIASVRLQMEAIDAIIADDEKNLALVRQKYAAGKVGRTDLALAEAQLENDRTPLPPLKQQMAAAEDALADLIGKSPAEWAPPAFALDDFTLPRDLPLSLPSELVHARPDILAAEAELHARSAAIGVATAQLYPNFNISAAFDPTATLLGARGEALMFNALMNIAVPIFTGGALEAQRQGTIEEFRAALAAYRSTVLAGLQQVADILRALGHDAELAQAERRALDASRAALALERDRYAAGKADLLRLLDAERSYQQARVGYARARTQRYLDSAQLLVALGGGGWWKDRPPCSDCGERVGVADQSAPVASPQPSSDAP